MQVYSFDCIHVGERNNSVIPADVMFSTAHKSKGLEFETVIIADDFTAAHNENEMSGEVDKIVDLSSPIEYGPYFFHLLTQRLMKMRRILFMLPCLEQKRT